MISRSAQRRTSLSPALAPARQLARQVALTEPVGPIPVCDKKEKGKDNAVKGVNAVHGLLRDLPDLEGHGE